MSERKASNVRLAVLFALLLLGVLAATVPLVLVGNAASAQEPVCQYQPRQYRCIHNGFVDMDCKHFNVQGESMQPYLPPGGCLVVGRFSYRAVSVGDFIAFNYCGFAGQAPVAHQVIKTGYDERGWFAVTKGTNTSEPDLCPVREEHYLGVAVLYY